MELIQGSHISNKIGYRRLAESIEWSGQVEFIKEEMKPWTAGSDNHVAGQTKIVRAKNGSGGALAWTEVNGAGHMVCGANSAILFFGLKAESHFTGTLR